MAHWYYNSVSGAIDSAGDVVSWFNEHSGLNDLLDWHGPFDSKDQAFKYFIDNKASHPDWPEPTDSGWKQFANSNGWVGDATKGAGDLLGLPSGSINVGNWVIRIGEIVLGIVLIGVGVAKLTGTTNGIAKLAKAAI